MGSVETLDKLRQTRDTLNDILTENDQLRIEDGLNTPWPSKRHEELRTDDDQPSGRNGTKRKTKDDDDDDIKNSSMDSLSKYLAGLVGNFGNKIITKSGNVDWTIAKKFVNGLKTDLGSKFDSAGRLAKGEIDLVIEKFDDLRKFVDNEGVQQHMQATRVAAAKLVKSLVGSVASLKEGTEDAAEKTDWASKFEREAAKMKSSLEKRWGEIRGKWEQAVKENEEERTTTMKAIYLTTMTMRRRTRRNTRKSKKTNTRMTMMTKKTNTRMTTMTKKTRTRNTTMTKK